MAKHLDDLGLLRDADVAAITRYVEAEMIVWKLRDEWVRMGKPVMTSGSMGQEVVHPLVQAITNAEAAAGRLGAALLLDPAARVRLKKDKPTEASPQQQIQRGIGSSPAQRLRSVG